MGLRRDQQAVLRAADLTRLADGLRQIRQVALVVLRGAEIVLEIAVRDRRDHVVALRDRLARGRACERADEWEVLAIGLARVHSVAAVRHRPAAHAEEAAAAHANACVGVGVSELVFRRSHRWHLHLPGQLRRDRLTHEIRGDQASELSLSHPTFAALD